MMATFFGEVLPAFSRAVDDDEDDVESESSTKACARWSPLVKSELYRNGKLASQIIIVAIGPAAAGFVQAYILNDDYDVVGALFTGMKDTDINTFEQMSPTDKTCYVYRSRSIPDVFLCLCKTDVNPEQAYTWTDELLSCIDISAGSFYMSILCTCPASDYRGDVPVADMNPPFLRSLKTTKFPGTPLCPYLEQPSLVAGLPAQLLTQCQISEVKAVLYICYSDTVFVDSYAMKTFLPLLDSTPIKDVIKVNPKAEEKISDIVDQYSSKDSLYL